jgi:pyruvate dehydrogenase E2 component (dihydrolipoamide acetyltransferase)
MRPAGSWKSIRINPIRAPVEARDANRWQIKESPMIKDVKVPEISENVTSGKIVEVLIEVGDTVAVDDVLLEMETEKAVVEIPSPYAGRVSEILASEGEEKNVGDVIARIEVVDADAAAAGPDEEDAGVAEPAGEEKTTQEDAEREAVTGAEAETEPIDAGDVPAGDARVVPPFDEADTESATSAAEERSQKEARFEGKPTRPVTAAPSVRRLARELGVDIHAVEGSGPGGRISAPDVHAHVKQRLTAQQASDRRLSGEWATASHPQLPDFSRWGPTRNVKIDTVRRLTAENTAASWRIIPHVTQFDEADITDLKPFIDKHTRQAEQQGGKLTLTAIVMKVCAAALIRFPGFNASIDLERETMIYKDHVHVGLAVDTPRGLLVPVMRNVQRKGIIELAVEIAETAARARNKKTKPDELEGATFTISNQGGIGGVNFTPVVVWPQAAILGISRSRRVPRELEGQFVGRTVLPLSLSYDHRIADGADAARFLDWIARSLEQGLTILL